MAKYYAITVRKTSEIMGIKHLKQIDLMFQSNPNVEFTKTRISKKFNIDYNTVCEAIDYLFFAKKIEKTDKGFKLISQ